MSIEALIQAHTEALLANTEAVKLLTLSLAGRTPAKSEDKAKAKQQSITETIKENLEASGVIKKANSGTEVNIEEGIDATLEEKDDIPDFEAKSGDNEYNPERHPVPYETVRSLVLKLAGAGKREEIKALNAKHGIANLKVLLDKEDDFSTVNDQAKLEAVYADLQKLEG